MESSDKEFYFDEENDTFYTVKGGESYEDFFKKLKPMKKDWSFHKVNDVEVTFSKNSKNIKFTKNGETKNIFVVNSYQVSFLLKKFKYNDYKIDGKLITETNFDDSLNFSEITYLENLLTKVEFNKAKENIENKNPIFLDDLSLIYSDYQKFKKNSEFIITNEVNEFIEKLKLLNKSKRFIPICGPKSIGKTTSLLYYLKNYAALKYFYINLSYCKKLLVNGDKKNLCLCICKELFNCLKFEDVNKFYNSLYEMNYVNIMDIVTYIIKYIDEKASFGKIYLVLDQYKEKIDKDYKVIKQIELKTKINNKFSVIICSTINEYDFRNSLNKKSNNSKEFYLDYLFINKLAYVNINIIKNELNDEEKILLKDSGNLFFYFHYIYENKNIKGKKEKDTRREIMKHIIKQINYYFSETDNTRKIANIETIHDNIDKKIKFCDLKEILSFFPLRYCSLTKEDKNMFSIGDLQDDTELIVKANYPIVIDCINEIFQNAKYEIKINLLNPKSSIELLDQFNKFLWFYKNSFYFYGCKIIKKIEITSFLEMKESDGKMINESVKDLKNISESILIIQNNRYAKHYDTAILKLISIIKDMKYFDLFLFKETLKTENEERFSYSKLIEDKTCLKYKFYLNSDIQIQNIYFSYVLDNDNLDKTTMNYCEYNNINYQIYDDENIKLIDSKINPIIISKFEYPVRSKENSDEKKYQYSLNILDINYTDDKMKLIYEYNKLQKFLGNKRKLKENNSDIFSSKINRLKDFVNNDFKINEINEQIAEEYLMQKENENIVGISFLVDNDTKNIKNKLNFDAEELKNLKEFMQNYNDDLEILKIIKLNKGYKSILMPNYDCCILQVNSKNEKSFINVQSNYAQSLKTKEKTTKIDMDGKFYLIKFTVKNMIYKEINFNHPNPQFFC